MAKITDLKDTLRKLSGIIDEISIIEANERTRCMIDVCDKCSEPYPVEINPKDKKYWHYSHPNFLWLCKADGIRKRIDKLGLNHIECWNLPEKSS